LLEARKIALVANAHFSLRRIEAPDAATLIRTVAEEQGRGVHFFLLDAPAAVVGKLAAAMKGKPALIFNIADASDDLRRKVCSAEIVHAAPSLAMLTDALIQYLVSKKWRNLVLLEGPDPADAVRAASYQRSARKFGARIVLHKTFRAGNDPRQRESNNPALLTALRGDYDAVIVADRAYEFARSLPYRINKPRPVIGAIGLTPVAWHWAWERNGAPQVNSRFRRLREKSSQHDRKDNQMSGRDWAAWISMKMIAQAVLQAGAGSFEKQRAAILRGSEFDGAKGLAVSVRPWDQQLRQPVLLAGADFVAANAPMPGFLHRTNRLDTLGDDRRETPCQLDGG
ncbi:MAG: amino acid ABC transporter substrate-binding protein, partial [Hyphomicrobiales bacterium]|nr:amino acid ABC transporter substrate-binding protein [Hyphomicrobiales bacterium]